MSVKAWFFKKKLKATKPRNVSVEIIREKSDNRGREFKVPADIVLTPENVGGVRAEWANRRVKPEDGIIIYLHGGSYCFGSVLSARAFSCGLAKTSNIPVLTIDYRLAPENPFPAALDDAMSVYKELLAKGHHAGNIFFIGDSAGGGLCVATAMKLRDMGVPLPGGIVLLSPWTDLTMTSESCRTMAKKDPVNNEELDRYCAQAYSNGNDIRNPHISPLFGSFKGLPPILIHGATDDIDADDAVKTYQRAKDDGVEVHFKMWKSMIHVFTLFYKEIPEGKASLKEIVRWMQEKLHS